MDFLIIDSDLAIHGFYKTLFNKEYRNVQLTFKTSAAMALSTLESQSFDLILTDSFPDEIDFFEFLPKLLEKNIPVIIVTSEISERFIVESLKQGAMDYISKRHIKMGYLPDMISRALLEAERWRKIQDFSKNEKHSEEYFKVNKRIQKFLKDDRIEIKRNLLSRGIISEKQENLRDGETYYIIYVYIHIFLQPLNSSGMDANRISEIRNMIMTKITNIPLKYGGRLWMAKDADCFFAFISDTHVPAVLSAIEINGIMNIFNVTIEQLTKKISICAGITAGRTVYRDVKGDIYSEALNLCAHLAHNSADENRIILSTEVFDNLWPRAKRYFIKTEPFEGHTIYKFANIR